MHPTIRIGTRVKTPVLRGRRTRGFMQGTVVEVARTPVGVLVAVDAAGTLCWYPASELLAA